MDQLNLLFYYFIIISNIEYIFSFQFENFLVQKETSNSIISVSQEKDLRLGSYLFVRFVSEISDGKDDLSF